MPSVLALTQSGFDPASRFRWVQFIPHLRAAGWVVDHRPNRPDRQWRSPLRRRYSRAVHYRAGRVAMKINRWRDVLSASRHDVVFVNRDLAGGGLLYERLLLKRNPRVVFDFDDAIFVGRNEGAVAWMCGHATRVTPGNEYLAAFARRHTDRVQVIPTVIDTDLYATRPNECDRGISPVRVGWSGSDQSIRTTLLPRLAMLGDLQRRVDFELVVISNTRPELDGFGLRWAFHAWRSDEEAKLSERMDVGIMPLADDEFQKGKCGLKLLQYMAAGLPTIASPVGVNRDIVQHGVTGFLAGSDDEWRQGIETLVRQGDLRARMGSAGRKRCVDCYSMARWFPVLTTVLLEASQSDPNGGAARSTR